MLLRDERSFQAHCLDGDRSVSAAGSARGGNSVVVGTAGHKTIPSAHRIEPTLHWSPGTGCLLSVDAVSPHDGPGAGLEPSRLRNFDRDGFRISTLDQRAGRSTPAASIMPRSLIATLSRASVN